PGKRMRWNACPIQSLDALNIAPHSGEDGGAPKPRKLKLAAEIIAPPIFIVIYTIMVEIVCGNTCLNIIVPFLDPMDLSASTYDCSLISNVSTRTIRAKE